MSYTHTEWKTGDVITAEKLNNMESGIVSGQNNAEFVKLGTFSMTAFADSHTSATGGPLQDGKTLGDIIGEKTVIGLTSKYRYNPSGKDTNFNRTKVPVQTCITDDGQTALWELPSFMMDNSIGLKVEWGDFFFQGSQVSSFYGELDVYAICI